MIKLCLLHLSPVICSEWQALFIKLSTTYVNARMHINLSVNFYRPCLLRSSDGKNLMQAREARMKFYFLEPSRQLLRFVP